MHTSGIAILAREGRGRELEAALAVLPGVELSFPDPESSRYVAVLETKDADSQEELLRRIQNLDSVALAELVCHHFDDEE